MVISIQRLKEKSLKDPALILTLQRHAGNFFFFLFCFFEYVGRCRGLEDNTTCMTMLLYSLVYHL